MKECLDLTGVTHIKTAIFCQFYINDIVDRVFQFIVIFLFLFKIERIIPKLSVASKMLQRMTLRYDIHTYL